MLSKLTLLVLAICFGSSLQHTGSQGHGSCPHRPVPGEDPETCCYLVNMTAGDYRHINPFCTNDGYLCYIPNLHFLNLKKCAGYCELSETLTGILSGFGTYHYHCNNGACTCNCCVPRRKREINACAFCIPFRRGCRNGVIVARSVPSPAQIESQARLTASRSRAPPAESSCLWYHRHFRLWIPASCACRHCGCHPGACF